MTSFTATGGVSGRVFRSHFVLKVASVAALAILFLFGVSPSISQAPSGVSNGSSSSTPVPLTTYSLGWTGISIPTTNENSAVFQEYWINEAMRTIVDAGSAFWIENATGSQTSCTVPWVASAASILSLAQTYGFTVDIQLPTAFTDYGSTTYVSLATDGYTNGLTTYNKFGQVAQGYVRVDTSLLSEQIYNDLIAMYKCFGQYGSWVGISQGSNSADLGGYDWYGPPGGPSGAGMHSMGTATIHDWLNDPYFYTPAGNDSQTYNMATKEPKVSTLSVFYNINAYHLQQFNNFLTWNDYNQVQLAINMFYKHTGKQLVYVDYDHEGVDRIYNFPPTQVSTLFKNITSIILSGSQPCRPNTDSCIATMMGNVDPYSGNNTSFMYSPGQCSVNGVDPPKQTLENYMYLYAYSGAITTGLQVDSSASSCSGLMNVNSNEYSVLNSYGVLLNRMANIGTFYGTDNPSAPRVLLVYQPSGTDANLGGEVAQFLGSADIDVTVSTDMNLTGIALSDYNAILYRPNTGLGGTEGVLTPYAASAVKSFVEAGGGLVDIPSTINGYWSTSYWNTYWSSVFGVKASPIAGYESGGTISMPQSSNEIFKPYGSSVMAGGYEPGLSGGTAIGTISYTPTSSSVTTIMKSSSLGPEVWTNAFGSGRVVMLPGGIPLASIYGHSSYDAFWSLVSNALAYASKDDSLIPILSYPTFAGGSQHEAWDQSTGFSVLGSPENGLLAWFFTNKTSGDSISVNLNAAAYHISTGGWVAIDAKDWTVVGSGSGVTISLSLKMSASGWYPVYIFSRAKSGTPLYSNVEFASSTIGTSSDVYRLNGPSSFSSWLVVDLSNPPTSVSASDTGSVTHYSTLASLNGSIIGDIWKAGAWQDLTQTGWYYDSVNQLLYVHFEGGSSISLTVGL